MINRGLQFRKPPGNLPTPDAGSAAIANAPKPETFFPMHADLRPIIEDIANRADDFLAGTQNRAHARAGIEEVLTMDYAGLSPADRTAVVASVMSVLEDEDFFGTEYVGDPFSEPDESDLE